MGSLANARRINSFQIGAAPLTPEMLRISALLLLHAYGSELWFRPVLVLEILLVGTLVGIEIPLLVRILRDKYLLPFESFTKIMGLPFSKSEMLNKIETLIG